MRSASRALSRATRALSSRALSTKTGAAAAAAAEESGGIAKSWLVMGGAAAAGTAGSAAAAYVTNKFVQEPEFRAWLRGDYAYAAKVVEETLLP